MKKILCLVCMLALFSGSAFAATTVANGTSVDLGDGNMFTPSAKVTVTYVLAADKYSAASAHLTGDRAFRTTQDSGIEKSDKNQTVDDCAAAGTACTFKNRP